jgi:hypothetical protein
MRSAENTYGSTKTSRKFFSLRWTALILLSLVLMAVNATLAIMAYHQSFAQFNFSQATLREQQNLQLKTLFEQSFADMSAFSNIIPLLNSKKKYASITTRLRYILNEHGAMLDLQWGVHSLYLLDKKGQTRLSWPVESQTLPQTLDVSSVFSNESPANNILCQPECLQYLTLPLLLDDGSTGALVMTRTIAEVLLEINRLTGSDIVVLKTVSDNKNSFENPLTSSNPANKRIIKNWDRSVPAITHSKINWPIITLLAEGINQSQLLHSPYTLKYEQEWYEIFKSSYEFNGISFLMINRVTSYKHNIETITRNSIFMGIAGLIISEILLFLILWKPLNYLLHIKTLLPLLAEHKFKILADKLVTLQGNNQKRYLQPN